jgi:glc operon protein GlcG
VETKNIAADEIRGSSIQGGDTREIAEGDVIVVPNGVPHWFKQISGPFTYYVVKVR